MSAWWVLPAACAWLGLLLVPWRPWSTRERLDPLPDDAAGTDLSDVVALVPARDEADNLRVTLPALLAQGSGLAVIVVDDESTDATAQVADAAGVGTVRVVRGEPLPAGWTGKVWALAQGARYAERRLVLLMDADVAPGPGLVGALRRRLEAQGGGLVSVMVELAMRSPWERALVPPFVWFFKLIYPFSLAARPGSRVAAAAGGCVLVEARVLRDVGGFEALRDALIDDCTLARLVKTRGHPLWIGLTRSARSLRRYTRLGDTWRMVRRTAYTQLGCSPGMLLACTMLMVVTFVAPLAALILGTVPARITALVALAAMLAAYVPLLRYYRVPLGWTLALPVAACLYLAMTWDSAIGHWRGRRSAWRGRRYSSTAST